MEDNLRLLRPLFRGFPFVVLAMVMAVLAAKKYLSYVTPMYESTAKLKLADIHEGVHNSNLFKDFDVFTTSNKIAAEIEVLKSRILIQKALDSLDFDVEIYRKGKIRTVELYHESPFSISYQFRDESLMDRDFVLEVLSKTRFQIKLPGYNQVLMGEFGRPLTIQNSTILIQLNGQRLLEKPETKLVDTFIIRFLSRQKLIDKISKDLDVIPVDKDVAVIRIGFKSSVPEKAARLVNQLAKSYIQDYIESKFKTAETTVQFLNGQIESVAGNLSKSESDIVKYRDDRNIVNLRQETETDLRQISQLKIQQTNVKMSLQAIQDLDNYIQAGKENFFELAPNFEAFTDLLSTEIIKNIKKLQAEKKDLLLQYTPQEEKVMVVDRKLDDLKSYLIESIRNTRKNLEIKDKRLNDDILEAERSFIGIPEKEKMLTILNREFDRYQKSYNFLTEKKIEAEIARSAKIAFHRVIAPAYAAKDPVSPNRVVIVIVAAILALIGSILIIYGIHAAKAKVNDLYTIEKNSGIPVSAITPKLGSEKEVQNHFLKLANQLTIKSLLPQNKVIVFSSFGGSEGRNFHLRSLANALRLQGKRTLVIRVGEEERVESDFITLNPETSKTRSATDLKNWLEEKVQSYQHILNDNENLKGETIGLILMSLASVNFLVLDSRRTSIRSLSKVELLCEEFKLPNVNFILNRAGYQPSLLTPFRFILQKIRP